MIEEIIARANTIAGIDGEDALMRICCEDAAAYVMDQRYQEYLSSKPGEAPVVPEVRPSIEELITGKRIYLCVRGGENTKMLLDVLARYNSYMTFFCTPEFMAENHNLLRRMDATGQGIGILATEGEGSPRFWNS